jgi:hypothetical protein
VRASPSAISTVSETLRPPTLAHRGSCLKAELEIGRRYDCLGGLLGLGAGRPGEAALIQALAEQGFDDGLPADVQFFGEAVQFVEHGRSEIHIDALDGLRASSKPIPRLEFWRSFLLFWASKWKRIEVYNYYEAEACATNSEADEEAGRGIVPAQNYGQPV